MIPMDPDNVVRNSVKWLQSLAIDSKDNVYVGWIMGGALSKYERATGKVSVFRLPTPHAIVYGVVADRNDNIWIAQWSGGKIAKFDTRNNQWTEFMPPTCPGHVRRLNVDYQNNIWWGIWAAGNRPGQAGEAGPDDRPDDRVHDSAAELAALRRGGGYRGQHLVRRFADAGSRRGDRQVQHEGPDVHVLSEAAVRRRHAEDPGHPGRRGLVLAARHPVDAPAISVLYPDMDKITTLGAYYVNGAPGYPFKVTPAPAVAAR